MNRRFDIRTIGMMIIDGLIAIAFLFMPWLSIESEVFAGAKSVTGAKGLFIVHRLVTDANELLGMEFDNASTGGAYLTIEVFFYILAVLPYVMIIGIAIALMYLFLNHNQDEFCRLSRRWLWVDFGMIIATWVVIFIGIVAITPKDSSDNYLTASITDALLDILHGGIGMKFIFIIFLIGIIAPWIIHLLDKNQINLPAEIMEFDSTGFKKPGWVPHVYEVAASRPAVHDERPQTQRAPRRSRSEGGVMPSAPALRLEGDGFSIGIMRFPATIGSDPHEAAYDLPDSSISPVHCRIDRVNGQLAIMDLGSVKGTYLSEHRLPENQQYYLMDGDQIRLGNIEMTVRIGMR